MADDELDKLRVERAAFSVTGLDESDLNAFWWNQSPEKRLEAVEIYRRMAYGYETPPRLQRILEIIER